MTIQALRQFSVTLPVTPSPMSLWAGITHVAIDGEAVAEAEERKPVSPLCVPSLGMRRWDEGSSEVTLWLWQVGCRRSHLTCTERLGALHGPRITQGQTSWHIFYLRAWKLDSPLSCICFHLYNDQEKKCFHFVSSLYCFSWTKANQPFGRDILWWCQM